MQKAITLALMVFTFSLSSAQNNYVAPSDTLVRQKLQQWQDLKFGLFMHWGTYSQWGVVESWSICPEDEGWTGRKGASAGNYFEYKKAYENLQTTFNPQNFHPEKWVSSAKNAGMKYVVFTTKHHDGFCMFDTKQTDYKITSPRTPFSTNARSNVAKEIFDAFRKENFLIGAYFSKPDWHTESYWWPYFPPKDRNVNYDPKKYPERWQTFKQFTFDQIKELMTSYGKMDILWLDGGWVRPLSSIDKNVEWQRTITYDQDIDMKNIAAMGRGLQPGLIIVDRSVGGEFENYQTPEQEVPAKPLSYPWETCMTMGNSWSYVPNDHYKSAQQLIQLLIKIVSRGGNFLLNIGPSADGDWDTTAYQRLKEIGGWMKINGEGIYNSKPISPYSSDNIFFTQSKDGKVIYAFYLSDKADAVLPAEIKIAQLSLNNKSKIQILGFTENIKWEQGGDHVIIRVPSKLQSKVDGKYAVVFKIWH
ncbi:MAG TPA: alpha-L-fucosidase [Puia sp.]|jgi:alpha-L-fucosidase|nr:alpha-L-fucosidase [Puia sp.]